MCNNANECLEVKNIKNQRQSDITKYWSVISGLVALVITIIVFYANTTNAMNQVNDHEIRLRTLEKSIIRTETLLEKISDNVGDIDAKLDKHIDRVGLGH